MDRRLIWFFALLAPVYVWSYVNAYEGETWWMEAAPAIIACVLIFLFRKKFPLTTMLLVLVWVHCVILLVGAHYTYARVPLFDWIRDYCGGIRNNYDKIGHLAQGFIPAIFVRELLIRCSPLGNRGDGKPSAWTGPLAVCACLAVSAFYELIEWWVAVWKGDAAEDFLGTQGYIWDTQSDMFMAMIGAIAAVLLLSKLHNRALAKRGYLKTG